MLIDSVKSALRISVNDYDEEINDLIDAALADLGVAGVIPGERESVEPIVKRAVVTYCKINFGFCDNFDAIKASYDEQKAQLSMNSDFTDFGGV